MTKLDVRKDMKELCSVPTLAARLAFINGCIATVTPATNIRKK